MTERTTNLGVLTDKEKQEMWQKFRQYGWSVKRLADWFGTTCYYITKYINEFASQRGYKLSRIKKKRKETDYGS